jgi:hypothetical protein
VFDLYRLVLSEGVPFNKWHNWV